MYRDDPRIKHFEYAIHGPDSEWERYLSSSLVPRVWPQDDGDAEGEQTLADGGHAPTTANIPVPTARAESEGAQLAARAEPLPERKEPFSAVATLAAPQRSRVRSSLAPVPVYRTMPHFSAVKAPNFSAVEEVKRLQRKRRANPLPDNALENATKPRQIPWKKTKPEVIDLTKDEPKPQPRVHLKNLFESHGLNMFYFNNMDHIQDVWQRRWRTWEMNHVQAKIVQMKYEDWQEVHGQ